MLDYFFFFFNETATTEIYTLSLHDALPICWHTAKDLRWPEHVTPLPAYSPERNPPERVWEFLRQHHLALRRFLDYPARDRKSTRLNSSHANISYAVFCLKKTMLHRPFLAIR